MGERQSDGGLSGRRRVHPEGAPSGSRAAGHDAPAPGGHRSVDAADLEVLLATALIRDGVDAAAEQRAVAAFRAAREAGAYARASTRRRDDWRPRGRRLGRYSVKAVVSVLLGGLTLSGVAVAAIGAAGSSTDTPGDDGRSTHASSGASAGTSPGTPGAGSGSGSERSAAARDAEALCRAYELVEGRGRALDATVWKRLVSVAGGEKKVDAYCAEQLAGARPGASGTPDENASGATGRAGNEGSAGAGNTGNTGGDASGNAGGDTAATAGTSGTDGTAGSGADGAGSGAGETSGGGEGPDGGAVGGTAGTQGKPAGPGGTNP
ncbi:hypothetical protein ACFYOV_12990 [Streptomyces sp. NPDC005931]|uniref:hypothetical protein n=1 Tax=Streptomyces sp. NPDC005931 TaxID=3364737 RepID=UPI0036B9665C